MIDQAVHQADGENVEIVLREELARGHAMAASVLPVLRHLVAGDNSSVFSDDVLARVRGMLADLADTLFDALSDRDAGGYPASETEALTRAFLDNPALLTHLHAQALEWQLTERFQARLALDPVVSPLLQGMVSSLDSAQQGLAMKFLAAQARWCQSQRRMKLPLLELPADLFQTVLVALRAYVADDKRMAHRAARNEEDWRARYDEGATRLGLASKLVLGMNGGGSSALSVGEAGAALFLTALALGSGQGRDAVVLSTHEAQLARLALALRMAGLEPKAVEREFLALHPDITLPPGFDGLSADHAAAILSSGRYSR